MWTHVFPSCFLCLPALFTIITIIDITNSIILLVTSCFSLSPICGDLMCIYRNHFKFVLEKDVRLLYIYYLVIFKTRFDNMNSTKMREWKNEDKPKFIQMGLNQRGVWELSWIKIASGMDRRRKWQPTSVLLPGKSNGQRSLVGCSPWGREESDTTERLHFHFSLSCTGEENGNLLQCSCLENPRDGGTWWAAVYGVAQSRTRLKQLSSSSKNGWQSTAEGRKASLVFSRLHLFKNNKNIHQSKYERPGCKMKDDLSSKEWSNTEKMSTRTSWRRHRLKSSPHWRTLHVQSLPAFPEVKTPWPEITHITFPRHVTQCYLWN